MADVPKVAFIAPFQREYLAHAAYYFYLGRTLDEQIRSVRHRIEADRAKERLLRLGISIPSLHEIRAYARTHLPIDQVADEVVS